MSRSDIECPGDSISYKCIIQSNSETIHLIWRVTVPGQMPINITYDSSFNTTNRENVLNHFVLSSLTLFDAENVESTIEFTVPLNVSLNQTALECFIEGLGSEIDMINVNISCKFYNVSPNLHCYNVM